MVVRRAVDLATWPCRRSRPCGNDHRAATNRTTGAPRPGSRAKPLVLGRIRREGHRAFDDHLPIDPADAFQLAHPAAKSKNDRFDFHDIAWMDRPPVTNAADAGKQWQSLPV